MLSFGMHILTSLGACAKEVQFYWTSRIYPAILYCTIFPFLVLLWHSCIIFVSKKLYCTQRGRDSQLTLRRDDHIWYVKVVNSYARHCTHFLPMSKKDVEKINRFDELNLLWKKKFEAKDNFFWHRLQKIFSTLQHLVRLERNFNFFGKLYSSTRSIRESTAAKSQLIFYFSGKVSILIFQMDLSL